jgi:putative lipoprotein
MPSCVTLFSRSVAPLLAACVAAACATAPDRSAAPPGQLTAFAYDCDDGVEIVVQRRATTGDVWVFLPGVSKALPAVPAASGAKFSDGAVTFWSKGGEALVEVDGRRLRCTEDRPRSLREDAKLRGVSFRATGNEPGWLLEITRGGDTVLVTDWGKTRSAFPTTEPVTDPATGRTEYRAAGGGRALTIVLEARDCRDNMSGERFPTTVTVRLDRDVLRGCGTPLH